MARSVPRVGEATRCDGQEPPVVALRTQREAQHPEGVGVAYHAVAVDSTNGVVALATRAYDELGDSSSGVGPGIRSLRREALVVVIVADEHDVGAGRVERAPDAIGLQAIAMDAGAEARMVPVGERATTLVRSQIGAQPLVLRTAEAAASGQLRAVRVHDDEVPPTEIPAVVTAWGLTRGGTEVIEIVGRAGRHVLVVARCGVDDRLHPAPGGLERRSILRQGGVLILVVAQQQHRLRMLSQREVGRGL